MGAAEIVAYLDSKTFADPKTETANDQSQHIRWILVCDLEGRVKDSRHLFRCKSLGVLILWIVVIAHRQCRLIWLILHQGTRYEERGPAVTKRSRYQRTWRMIRQLRNLGYRIELPNPQASQAQA